MKNELQENWGYRATQYVNTRMETLFQENILGSTDAIPQSALDIMIPQ